jgi:membrane protein YqaA with SNARE-associated domain
VTTVATGRLATPVQDRPRRARLALVGVALMGLGLTLWAGGQLLSLTLVRYAGLMTMGTTFLPLPADTFTLAAAAHDPALAVALVGGAVNAAVVLVERHWILILIDHPRFDRVRRFFDTNRFVALTDRSMFLTLLIAGFLFYEPFRLLAVMRRYPPARYVAAAFISRTVRYYALATLGAVVFEQGYLRPLLLGSFSLFLFGVWRSAVKLARHRRDAVSLAAGAKLGAGGTADASG